MKPRPGRIAEIVDVDLPRPRTLDMITTPKFGAIVDHIRGRLDKGGVPVSDARRRNQPTDAETVRGHRLGRGGPVHRPRPALRLR